MRTSYGILWKTYLNLKFETFIIIKAKSVYEKLEMRKVWTRSLVAFEIKYFIALSNISEYLTEPWYEAITAQKLAVIQ